MIGNHLAIQTNLFAINFCHRGLKLSDKGKENGKRLRKKLKGMN